MSFEFTKKELDILKESVIAIETLIHYHECAETMGDAMGFDCSYHASRAKELHTRKEMLQKKEAELE
jgi:hypothetical protein